MENSLAAAARIVEGSIHYATCKRMFIHVLATTSN